MSDLQKLLEDGETQKALALVNEDEYAWEDLLGLLEGSDEDMQRSAFEIVSKAGDHPRLLEALPMLILGLSSDEDDICRYAAEAMYYMGSDAAEASESLSSLLTHDDDEVRRAVARVFSQMGSSAIDGKDALTDALSDSDEAVRGEAALALGNLGNEVREAVPRLIDLLTDEEEFIHDGESIEVRNAAKTALEQIGSDAVPGLLEAMRGDRPEQRAIAVNTLAGMDFLPEGAVKDIEEAVQDPDESVQAAARSAMKRIKASKD